MLICLVSFRFDCNDWKFCNPAGFSGPQDWEIHLKNAFDTLYAEGCEGMPKMMTIGLHCRQAGKPGRFPPLKNFVEYIEKHEGVWVATRSEIAEHFKSEFPYKKGCLA
jgi:peptidoglycan/xylan/chitin deacetylase (PgdA/CDA1 family)